jgi:hypothetical protein
MYHQFRKQTLDDCNQRCGERTFPRESHVFQIIVTPLYSTDNKHGVQRQVSVTKMHVFNHLESVTKLHVFNPLLSVANPQVFYYLEFDAKIFDIIYQLSPFSGRQTFGSHSNKGGNCIRSQPCSGYSSAITIFICGSTIQTPYIEAEAVDSVVPRIMKTIYKGLFRSLY